jgi:hypothetical protein
MNIKNVEVRIVGRWWMHSHEEDGNEGMVFRPSGFAFPPSRGREGFELRPDHSFADMTVAPADGTTQSEGTWEIVDEPSLAISLRRQQGPARFLRIIRADKDRLILQS